MESLIALHRELVSPDMGICWSKKDEKNGIQRDDPQGLQVAQLDCPQFTL